MKRLCGYDVNGWRDVATRNWLAKPGEEGEEDEEVRGDSVSDLKTVDGGILPSVVSVGNDASGRWVGGIPASLAPHGRGDAWGDVGKQERRIPVRRCLLDGSADTPAQQKEATQRLAAAFTGVSPMANYGVAAIDDLPTTTELLQERILDALKYAGVTSPLLAWRPALAALYQIEYGETTENVSIGVICQAGPGFSVQTLKVRRGSGRDSKVLAPERKAAATLVRSTLGYEGLVEAAGNALDDRGGATGEEYPATDTAVGRLAFGEPVKPEILRKGGWDWRILDPPASLAFPKHELDDLLPSSLGDVDVILFETLTSGDVRRELHQFVSDAAACPVELLPADAIATAAFLAARRLSERHPVCFDFLPRISTLVHSSLHGVVNFDLIDENETLPAGEVYRSPEPARLHVPADKESFSIYLRKENAKWPRKAEVEIGTPFERVTPVELSVEQSPAAGRAKLYLRSTSPVRQFMVDWDASDEIEKSWDDLIEDLRDKSKPTIPKRLVLPNHLEPWKRLGHILKQNAHKLSLFKLAQNPNWKQLADAMAQPVSESPLDAAQGMPPAPPAPPKTSHYCISSDGDIPKEVPHETVAQLKEMTEQAFKEVKAQIDFPDENKDPDRSSLRFLTWQFRKCPEDIAEWLLDAVRADQAGHPHPLIVKNTDRVLVFQGLGRTARSKCIERAAIQTLLKKPADKWSYRCEMACAAFLLSRSRNIAKLVDRGEVESLADRAIMYFDEAHGTLTGTKKYTRFQYALFLLVGLLRWRKKEPYSLVSGQDLLATRMADRVETAINDIEELLGNKNTAKLIYSRYLRQLNNVLDELQGKGTNPDILLQIYGAK